MSDRMKDFERFDRLMDDSESLSQPVLHRAIERERQLLGIDPHENRERFYEAHTEFINGAEAFVQERFPQAKEKAIDGIASYIGRGDEEATEKFRELFSDRLASTTRINMEDGLLRPGRGAAFNRQRQVVLNSSELIFELTNSHKTEDVEKWIDSQVIAHELTHGMMTAATQDQFLGATPVRNGLQITDTIGTETRGSGKAQYTLEITKKHANWVNEAFIESTRRRAMETGDKFTYEPAVMVLEALYDLDLELEDKLITGAFGSQGPAVAYGAIENLLGPTGIEEVEQILLDCDHTSKLGSVIEQVVSLLPEEHREKAAKNMNHIAEMIIETRK